MARITHDRTITLRGPSAAEGLVAGMNAYKKGQDEALEAERKTAEYDQTMRVKELQLAGLERREDAALQQQANTSQFYQDLATGNDRGRMAQLRKGALPRELKILELMEANQEDPEKYERKLGEIEQAILGRKKTADTNAYRTTAENASELGVFDLDGLHKEDEAYNPESPLFNLARAQDRLREILESHSTKQALLYDQDFSAKHLATLRENSNQVVGDDEVQQENRARVNAIAMKLAHDPNVTDRERSILHGELTTLYSKDSAAHAAFVQEETRLKNSQDLFEQQANSAAMLGRAALDRQERAKEAGSLTVAQWHKKIASTDESAEEAKAMERTVLSATMGLLGAYPNVFTQDTIGLASAQDEEALRLVYPMLLQVSDAVLRDFDVVLTSEEALSVVRSAMAVIEGGATEEGTGAIGPAQRAMPLLGPGAASSGVGLLRALGLLGDDD